MRNINELIGIIKGINFDGVINQMEVKRLKSWVNKNRNLAYELKEAQLIRLVDQVLEDMIVTDDERELLISYCDKYLKGSSDDTAKIYELNGIIEGIVCDNEVNEREVYHLKAWMDNHAAIVRNHKPSASICKIIDDILADGIVTAEEQETLLQMLSARISSTQLETKIEFLRKRVRERINIGIDLIDLLDNENAIGEIHNRAEAQLGKTLMSYSGMYLTDPEIVFISLVLIAMLHYDGTYYDDVRTTYRTLYQRYSEQKVEGLIRTILSRYRSEEEANKKTRIINVALANAIVPSHFLKSFFEFIYDIYKLNFEYDISEDLYEDFKFVYEGLRYSMLSDGDDIQVNVTKKSYKLIKSTKQLIANPKYIDAVIKLSIIVVRLIDKKVWNKEVKVYNPYLKQGYEGWLMTLKDDKDAKRRHTRSEFRSRWEPKYILDNNNVYIVPPIHRVKAQYDYRDIRIAVKNGNEIIYTNKTPDIREIIGGYQISANRILLNKPLGEVTYLLLAGEEIIYDSKSRLYRDFLVFDEKGNEIQNNTDYTGTAVFCMDESHPKMKCFYKSDGYMLSAQHIRLGEARVVKNTVFNFSSLIRPGIMGDRYENHYLRELGSDVQLPVYKNVNFLVYESENTTGKFDITINGRSHKLEDYKYTITEREGVNKYVINLDDIESGIYSIDVTSLYKGKRMRVFSCDFAIDKAFHTDCRKNGIEAYLVSVDSDLLPNSIIEEIVIADFNEDWLQFDLNGKTYAYYIPFEFDIYRINGGAWVSFEKEIWIEDVRQDTTLDIYGTKYEGLLLLANSGAIIDETPSLKDKGVYRQTGIGFLVSYKTSFDYVTLARLKDGRVDGGILCYNKCMINEQQTTIAYNPETKLLDVCPRFYGKGRLFFKIENASGIEIYKSELLENGVEENVYDLDSFVNYKISFYEKEKGLHLQKERFLKSYDRIFYDKKDFVGRSFKIKEVYFDQNVRGEFVHKKHYFNTTYLYFTKMLDKDLFEGEVYARTYNGAYMLNNINPVEIEICSDVIDGIIELSITKEGDGLLLDFEHHGILNSMDDDSAVDIYSYSMEICGEVTF
jgi:hypothetical protein